jgi:hypothetical protein
VRPAQTPGAFHSQEENMTETTETTPSADNANSDWDAKQAAYDRLHAQLQISNKAALFDALAAAGVTIVVVSFDGYGDNAQIENIEVKAGEDIGALPAGEIEIARAAWGNSEPQHATVSIHDAVEQLAYDLLAATHSGWENNEGAYGEFTFDVAARTITLDYNERRIESANHQHVF